MMFESISSKLSSLAFSDAAQSVLLLAQDGDTRFGANRFVFAQRCSRVIDVDRHRRRFVFIGRAFATQFACPNMAPSSR